MARKTRSDSKLDRLDAEVKQDLIDLFLHGNTSLTDAREWLSGEHEVSISLSSLHAWYQRAVWPLKLEMRKQRATMANALISEAQGLEVDWNAALEEELKQKAYEMMAAGGDEKQALAYARTALDIEAEKKSLKLAKAKLEQAQEKLELDERRVALLEEKAAEAKALLETAATDARAGGMTEETLRKIEEAAGLL